MCAFTFSSICYLPSSPEQVGNVFLCPLTTCSDAIVVHSIESTTSSLQHGSLSFVSTKSSSSSLDGCSLEEFPRIDAMMSRSNNNNKNTPPEHSRSVSPVSSNRNHSAATYPIFSSLAQRLSRYGIEVDESHIQRQSNNHKDKDYTNEGFEGYESIDTTLSTCGKCGSKCRKESNKRADDDDGNDVTSGSNTALSGCGTSFVSNFILSNDGRIQEGLPTERKRQRQTSKAFGNDPSCYKGSGKLWKKNGCDDGLESTGYCKSKPISLPQSVYEEMTKKGFKNWSRRQMTNTTNKKMHLSSSSKASYHTDKQTTNCDVPSNGFTGVKMGSLAGSNSDVENQQQKMPQHQHHAAPVLSRRKSVMVTLFGQVGDRRFSQDLRKLHHRQSSTYSDDKSSRSSSVVKKAFDEYDDDEDSCDDEVEMSMMTDDDEETAKVIFFQVFIPFLVAGFGNVGAGLILDRVQHWPVFRSVTELFLLVASFLGFKGNLEMTLAARLATQANTGQLEDRSVQVKVGIGNVALIQCQAIVVGFLAAMIAITVNYFKGTAVSTSPGVITTSGIDSALLIVSTALVTASVTGLFLTILMVLVTILSMKIGVNPDNVSTLIAAFLGDISATILLSYSAKLFYEYIENINVLAPAVCGFFILVLLPTSFWIARKNEYTKDVVGTGWLPIIIAMVISSIGGLIFDFAVETFETIAVFQTIINGVGSNLVAVQASRISTYFHQRCELGVLPLNDGINYQLCSNPLKAFFGSNPNVKTARLLLFMSLPGHIIYIVTIRLIQGEEGKVYITLPFLGLYLLAAVIQVMILMYLAHLVVPFLWLKSIDPDNAAIPGIMSCGDLLGTAFLTIAFLILGLISDPNVALSSHPELKITISSLTDMSNSTLL